MGKIMTAIKRWMNSPWALCVILVSLISSWAIWLVVSRVSVVASTERGCVSGKFYRPQNGAMKESQLMTIVMDESMNIAFKCDKGCMPSSTSIRLDQCAPITLE